MALLVALLVELRRTLSHLVLSNVGLGHVEHFRLLSDLTQLLEVLAVKICATFPLFVLLRRLSMRQVEALSLRALLLHIVLVLDSRLSLVVMMSIVLIGLVHWVVLLVADSRGIPVVFVMLLHLSLVILAILVILLLIVVMLLLLLIERVCLSMLIGVLMVVSVVVLLLLLFYLGNWLFRRLLDLRDLLARLLRDGLIDHGSFEDFRLKLIDVLLFFLGLFLLLLLSCLTLLLCLHIRFRGRGAY